MNSTEDTREIGTILHQVKGQNFLLLPDKAFIWQEKRTLILADLHIGKATHFRKSGIAVPTEVEQANFDRLAQLILDHEPSRVLLLGDLFHSHYNEQWKVLLSFLDKFLETAFMLVMGNHDILEPERYLDIPNMICEQELRESPFLFTHEPMDKVNSLYNICGHIHPGVVLRGTGMQSLRLPCFHFMLHQLVLPAFGEFTGTHRIEPGKEDVVFALSGKEVIQVL